MIVKRIKYSLGGTFPTVQFGNIKTGVEVEIDLSEGDQQNLPQHREWLKKAVMDSLCEFTEQAGGFLAARVKPQAPPYHAQPQLPPGNVPYQPQAPVVVAVPQPQAPQPQAQPDLVVTGSNGPVNSGYPEFDDDIAF